MEITSTTIETATHSVRHRRNSRLHSTTAAGSPPWSAGADLPPSPVSPWRAGGVAMYDLRISLRERRFRSYTRSSSVTVAQSSCCDTLGVKHDACQRRMPPSNTASPSTSSANALAPKSRNTRSGIRRSASQRRSKRHKRGGRVVDNMMFQVREQWEQQDGRTLPVTEESQLEPENMGSTPVFAEVDSLSIPTISAAVGLTSEAMDSESQKDKPKILIVATGGTIAGRGASPTHSSGYQSGVICVDDLVEAVPNLKDVANVSTHQICMVGSPDLPSKILIELSQFVQTQLEREDLDAIVITHGTDTLEETSFFLDLTVSTSKPVIVTGSMLPSTSLSADGPKNLYDAVCVGANPGSQDRGVLVVFNSNIMPARFTVKSDANMVHTFDPGHQGCLGQVIDDTPLYYWPPARAIGHRHIDISALNPENGLPRVGVLYGHLGVDDGVFEMYVQGNVKGLVLAGMGAGCWTHQGKEQLEKIVGRNREGVPPDSEPLLPVVASSRCARGCVSLKKDIFGVPDWVIRSGFLNPAKACKLLQVCLAVGKTQQQIKTAFSLGPSTG